MSKETRSNKKRAVTKEANYINQLIAEDEVEEVPDHVKTLKGLFNVFSTIHDEYHDTLIEDAAIEESEQYFGKVQTSYIEVLTKAKEYLKGINVKDDEDDEKSSGTSSVSSSARDDLSRGELMALINLPKVELEVYDGDPTKYHTFMAAFDQNVEKLMHDDQVKLTRLLQYTTSDAKAAIRACALVGGERGYKQARSILAKRFGNNHLVADHIIKHLLSNKPVKSGKEVQQLADDLICGQQTLAQIDKLNELDSQKSIIDIIQRLPPYLQVRWKKLALKVKKERDSYPPFGELVEFMAEIACEMNDPVYGQMNPRRPHDAIQKDKFKKKSPSQGAASFNSAAGSFRPGDIVPTNQQDSRGIQRPRRPEPPCVLCGQGHRLWYCDAFKNLKPNQRRLEIVQQHKLCENCLLANHETSKCFKRSVCSVEGCGKKHTKWIHVDLEGASQGNNDNDLGPTSGAQAINANTRASIDSHVYMPIVEVKVNKNANVYALLDTASTNSFCSKNLVDMLNISGKQQDLNLTTLQGSRLDKTEIVDLDVKSVNNLESMHMSNVYVVKDIPVHTSSINVRRYPYLGDIAFASTNPNIKVDILIGQDNAEALVPLEIRKGRRGEPFAIKTLFGWCLNGSMVRSDQVPGSGVISHFITSGKIDPIEEQVYRLWTIENERDKDQSSGMSCTDKRVLDLWEKEIKLVHGHYELPIPWKESNEAIPNNVSVAKQCRLQSLENSLIKKGWMERYDSEIRKMLMSNYAEAVPQDEICKPGKIWYLPHHPVVTEKKPDKLRVVFDCAAKFEGESLNDKCFQGPDLNNNLIKVLLNFRIHPYGIMCDIESMYNQVKVPSKDKDALRFLWIKDGQVTHYRMTSHLFGGVWCASCATYALRYTTRDDKCHEDDIKKIIHNHFYVDDCLKSTETKEEARHIMKQTKSLLSQGGFNLTKFVVNDSELLMEIPEKDRAKEVKILNPNTGSKALGIHWNVMHDQFYFDTLKYEEDKVTRRKILSLVSSLFDPLGLLSPVLVTGRLLFQEATRLKFSWDQEVPEDLKSTCLKWLKELSNLSEMKIPRCIKPGEFTEANAVSELHHFGDASQRAYGCCTYLRCLNKNGQISTSLVMSKSRVAPLKQLTIPRLELRAAVLSAKADSLLRRELDMRIDRSYFWTDSEIVLKYIKNETRRFQIFVENRISTIRQLSDPDDWYHVSTEENPADAISRGMSVSRLDKDKWIKGPGFLRNYKGTLTLESKAYHLGDDDPEVKRKSKNLTCMSNVCDIDHPIERLANYYSSWYRLKRATAWLLRVKARLRHKEDYVLQRNLSLDEVKNAEEILIRHVQMRYYDKEMAKLTQGKPIHQSSPLKRLNPLVGENSILRVGGRLRHAKVSDESKHPCIIPPGHPVARLIIREIHDAAHLGTEWVLSIIRRKYWVIKARPLIKKIAGRCVTCKKLYAPAVQQKMADLPPERLEPNRPPFTYTGLDCFGPVYVKRGRSEIKRYGCIFSCLTTRAVHIEKLDDMSTDSFINGLRRFMSRRGKPEKIWSDNGTNFRGAEVELSRCLKHLDQDKIFSYCTKSETRWIFNPPSASHMGGIWERMIRTTRKILVNLIGTTILSDDTLETTFCEVETIINGRPLTRISDDVRDPSPLTPNHLLLLREGPVIPPGSFDDKDIYRKRWRQAQHLANQFWKRWLREYLPELQHRNKWNNQKRNLTKGDLVLLMNEGTPRNLWPMGIVTEVNCGRDDLVRSVTVKTKATSLVRPITKVVLIEEFEEEK